MLLLLTRHDTRHTNLAASYVGVAEQFGKSGTVTNRARTWEETNLMPSRQDTSPYLLDRQSFL